MILINDDQQAYITSARGSRAIPLDCDYDITALPSIEHLENSTLRDVSGGDRTLADGDEIEVVD